MNKNSSTQKLGHLLTMMLVSLGLYASPGLAQQSAPDRTEIGNIDTFIRDIQRNHISENVQMYRAKWEIAQTDWVLDAGNWLVTGERAMAWMWYNNFRTIYRQHANTLSRYSPGDGCGFQLEQGKILYLDHNDREASCYLITGSLQIRPASLNPQQSKERYQPPQNKQLDTLNESTGAGFFTSRSSEQESTLIGVLANPGQGPLEIVHQALSFSSAESNGAEDGAMGNTIQLSAGEFVVIKDDGRFVKGEFSLDEFYQNNPLALGLGDAPQDQAYVDTLVNLEERSLFEAIRVSTLSALSEQPPSGAFEIQRLNTFNGPSIFSPAPGCPNLGIKQVEGPPVNTPPGEADGLPFRCF